MTDHNKSVYDTDRGDPAGAVAAQQTVTNDAVAGEPVTDDDGSVRLAREAAPSENESAPANDGYLAPRNDAAEEVDLGDDDGRDGPVEVTQDDSVLQDDSERGASEVHPEADGPADTADGSNVSPELDEPRFIDPDDRAADFGSGLHP